MKFLQSAVCGFLLTVTAAAQTATPPASTSTPKPATDPAGQPRHSPRISTLGGDAVKGPEHPLTLDQMKALYVALGYDKQVADMDANLEKMIATEQDPEPIHPAADSGTISMPPSRKSTMRVRSTTSTKSISLQTTPPS